MSQVGIAVFDDHKVPQFSDAKKLCCNLPKIQTKWPNLRILCQNNANGIVNSGDPDQTAPLGAVLSRSALFAQIYLSENLRSLRFIRTIKHHFSPSPKYMTESQKAKCTLFWLDKQLFDSLIYFLAPKTLLQQ